MAKTNICELVKLAYNNNIDEFQNAYDKATLEFQNANQATVLDIALKEIKEGDKPVLQIHWLGAKGTEGWTPITTELVKGYITSTRLFMIIMDHDEWFGLVKTWLVDHFAVINLDGATVRVFPKFDNENLSNKNIISFATLMAKEVGKLTTKEEMDAFIKAFMFLGDAQIKERVKLLVDEFGQERAQAMIFQEAGLAKLEFDNLGKVIPMFVAKDLEKSKAQQARIDHIVDLLWKEFKLEVNRDAIITGGVEDQTTSVHVNNELNEELRKRGYGPDVEADHTMETLKSMAKARLSFIGCKTEAEYKKAVMALGNGEPYENMANALGLGQTIAEAFMFMQQPHAERIDTQKYNASVALNNLFDDITDDNIDAIIDAITKEWIYVDYYVGNTYNPWHKRARIQLEKMQEAESCYWNAVSAATKLTGDNFMVAFQKLESLRKAFMTPEQIVHTINKYLGVDGQPVDIYVKQTKLLVRLYSDARKMAFKESDMFAYSYREEELHYATEADKEEAKSFAEQMKAVAEEAVDTNPVVSELRDTLINLYRAIKAIDPNAAKEVAEAIKKTKNDSLDESLDQEEGQMKIGDNVVELNGIQG